MIPVLHLNAQVEVQTEGTEPIIDISKCRLLEQGETRKEPACSRLNHH